MLLYRSEPLNLRRRLPLTLRCISFFFARPLPYHSIFS